MNYRGLFALKDNIALSGLICKRLIFISIFIRLLLLVHPCDKPTKGGCEQVCDKKGDEALCGCKEGYKVSAEDKSKCTKSKCLLTYAYPLR